MEQMTIFDFLQRDESFEGKTLAQIAADISMLVGVSFNPHIWKDGEIEYVAKLDRKNKLTLDEDTYNTEDENDGKRFIGAGYDFENHTGGGIPCDTIDQAVAYFRKLKQEYLEKIKGRGFKEDEDI